MLWIIFANMFPGSPKKREYTYQCNPNNGLFTQTITDCKDGFRLSRQAKTVTTVADICREWQRVAKSYRELQTVADSCRELQRVADSCRQLQTVAGCQDVLSGHHSIQLQRSYESRRRFGDAPAGGWINLGKTLFDRRRVPPGGDKHTEKHQDIAFYRRNRPWCQLNENYVGNTKGTEGGGGAGQYVVYLELDTQWLIFKMNPIPMSSV